MRRRERKDEMDGWRDGGKGRDGAGRGRVDSGGRDKKIWGRWFQGRGPGKRGKKKKKKRAKKSGRQGKMAKEQETNETASPRK
jgi:hypothetical protein